MATALKIPFRYLDDYEGVVILQPQEDQDWDALYEQVCQAHEAHSKIEQDEEGNVYVMPPVGGESGWQETEAVIQLALWAKRKGHGKVFGPATTFVFPNKAKHCPDAAWASNERVYAIPYRQRRQRIPIVPEFVIEIKSPTDVYEKLQRKMDWYLRNGVELGWLIHPDKREVKIYTALETSTLKNIDKLRGTGPINGFTLDLRPIWKGLRDEGE
ncbi:MAG: Uma2 family endonuclease [Acidobacteriaceae bacterium]|nr:Uma2 family endonuclease [Acidobacteriaceae bacterium]